MADVLFLSVHHDSFSGTNDSADSPHIWEWSRHCPNVPPDSLPLLFTHSEKHSPWYPPSVSTAQSLSRLSWTFSRRLSDLSAPFKLNLRQAVW